MRGRLRTVLATVGAAGAALTTVATAQTDEPRDLDVALTIERELARDALVPANRIDVTVEDGVATVSGNVRELLDRDRAVRIARSVRGVESVIARVEVQPVSARSDGAVRRDVEDALLRNPATESYELEVRVDDGLVTLSGTVESWRENELALFVAKNVRGVIGVRDEVEVEFTDERTDAEIRAEIAQTLDWNLLVDAEDVEVRVEGGEVDLLGRVGSAAERWEARRAAWTAGVEDVDASALRVADPAEPAELRNPELTPRPDAEIRDALGRALELDPRVDAEGISMVVASGEVTLFGQVDELADERAAQSVAENTVGVNRVESFVKVRPDEPLDDGEIEDRIQEAFVRDATVERFELAVDVFDGTATLSGTVDSALERARAETLAAQTAGVEEIVDLIDVSGRERPVDAPWLDPWPVYGPVTLEFETPLVTSKSDAAIRDDIGDEYFWSPFVDGDAITVTVEDGVATLTGTVADNGERVAAVENAYEGGAVLVNDELQVR